MLHRSFKPAKCKTALKLAVSRLKLLKNKKEAQVKQMKRELAQLLDSGQVQTARIRVEHVSREEKTIRAYDLIETYCELIVARMAIIESQKNCPIDLKEAISSVIFASPRCADIPELMDVRKHFTAKYGKEFVSAAVELRPDCGVHRMLVEKLSAKAPDGPTKVKILSTIAAEHNVKWDPDSFGDTGSMPSEDLLNGPKTFETASKVHTESLPGSTLPNHDNKESPDVQVTNKLNDRRDVFVGVTGHDAGSSSLSQNFSSTDVDASKETTSGIYHPEVRSSRSGTEQMEFKHSYSGDRNAHSYGRQHFNMQFKDATSAAQAAAESAERASMAARAAAELSRQYSSESQKSSGNVTKDEGPQNNASSNWQGVHVAKAPENNAYHGRNSAMHDDHIVAKKQEEPSGMAESSYGDRVKSTDGYGQPESLKFTTASIDNKTLVSGFQNADRYPQKKSSEPKKSDLLGEGSKKKESSEPVEKSFSKLQDDVESEGIAYIGDSRTRKQSSTVSFHSHSSSFSDDEEDVLRKNDYLGYFEEKRTDMESSKSPSHSPSHSNTFNEIYKGEDIFVNEGSFYSNAEQINSRENATFVFDDSGSDDDNCKFDVEDYKEQESNSYFSPPSRKSSMDLLTNATVWSPKQNLDEGQGRLISMSHSSIEQRSPVFSESVSHSSVPSKPDELLPVAFDDSDGSGSDSEDLFKSKLVESMTTSDEVPHKNVYPISSEKLQNPTHSSVESSSDNEGNVGSRRKSWLLPSHVDLEPKEERPEKSEGIKFSPVYEKKFYDVELPTGLPSARLMKDGLDSNVEDNFHAPDSPDTMKDTELSKESDKELKFGMLTGGLRNKGIRNPPYTRKSLGNSLAPKEATEDTFSKIEQSTSSPTVIGSVAHAQEPHNQKGNTNLKEKASVINLDSDDRHFKGKPPQHMTSRSQEPYIQKSSIEINKRVNSGAASVTYFDSDNSDTEESISKMTSTSNARRGRGLSQRTKVSPSKYGKTSFAKATALSETSVTAKAESRSSSKSSYAAGILPSRMSETNSSDHSRGEEQHRSMELDTSTSKPVPESQRSSARVDGIKLSSRKQKLNSPIKTEASSHTDNTEKTSSKEKASHVHPKLPDYDALTAHFRSLRQSD
ncbi:hypothetical protein FNV43_RR04675 [Rhamnella rubrinervis]|uniref:Uncharacterized protein n=1 Tax=Rhamnella rubrinervis TaxID=2594499 RepID=A0A8K0HME7_9ROSA|nr:hypothetical protein FNV43_RR04675 [Rhamnella rubrinervis]